MSCLRYSSHTNTDELKYAIEVALDNPDPKVRLEALTNLPSQDIDSYQSMLRKMLSDGSKRSFACSTSLGEMSKR